MAESDSRLMLFCVQLHIGKRLATDGDTLTGTAEQSRAFPQVLHYKAATSHPAAKG